MRAWPDFIQLHILRPNPARVAKTAGKGPCQAMERLDRSGNDAWARIASMWTHAPARMHVT